MYSINAQHIFVHGDKNDVLRFEMSWIKSWGGFCEKNIRFNSQCCQLWLSICQIVQFFPQMQNVIKVCNIEFLLAVIIKPPFYNATGWTRVMCILLQIDSSYAE